jgi:hypothetical protein
MVTVARQPNLLQIVGALRARGSFTHLLHRRHQERDQNGDDRDHHQEFNERERSSRRIVHGSSSEVQVTHGNAIRTYDGLSPTFQIGARGEMNGISFAGVHLHAEETAIFGFTLGWRTRVFLRRQRREARVCGVELANETNRTAIHRLVSKHIYGLR